MCWMGSVLIGARQPQSLRGTCLSKNFLFVLLLISTSSNRLLHWLHYVVFRLILYFIMTRGLNWRYMYEYVNKYMYMYQCCTFPLTSSHRMPWKLTIFCWNGDRRASKHAFRFMCLWAGSLVNTSPVTCHWAGWRVYTQVFLGVHGVTVR